MPARPAILAVLLLVTACAKHEVPAPNKNTNWLQQCASDSECGADLSCLCGLCTVPCEASAECGAYDSTSTCLSTESAQHAELCGSEDVGGVCVASSPGDGGQVDVEDIAPMVPNPTGCVGAFGVCATVMATDQGQPLAIAVDDERVYWLRRWDDSNEEGTGQLVSVPRAGGDLTIHASRLHYPRALKLDATHAYWVHYTRSTWDRKAISRVELVEGAEVSQIYNVQHVQIEAIGLAGDSVYWRSWRSGPTGQMEALLRAPKDGSLVINPLFEPEPAEVIRDDIGALSEAGVHRVLRDYLMGLGIAPDAHAAVGWNVALHDDEIFWLWERQAEGMNMEVLTPSAVGVERATADAEEHSMLVQLETGHLASSIAVDDTHVYWTYEDVRGAVVERTDRRTGLTETVFQNASAWALEIALAGDEIFLALGGIDSASWTSGMIIRFPKHPSSIPGPL